MDLRGAVAVVTGAASGIGRACALAFAGEGADVVLADIDAEGCAEAAEEVRSLGGLALDVPTDVEVREQVEDLVDRSVAWKGHCELFMSNAGVAVGGPPHLIPLEDWEWIVNVNLWPHIWATRKVIPHMLERGRGHLVHTASSAGVIGFPSLVPYCVTKFAVVGLCESLAAHLHASGIGVSVVCPLFVATNIMHGSRMTSERELDEATEERLRTFAQEMFRQAGIPPEQVAADVVEAVREGRLYVFPHPELKDMVDDKWRDPEAWLRGASEGWRAQQELMESLLQGG